MDRGNNALQDLSEHVEDVKVRDLLDVEHLQKVDRV
jgi:hypothetical protein